MQVKYLLDANIFIQSHNLHYHPSFCELFWDWVIEGHSAGIFFSIDKIKSELVRPVSSEDELSERVRGEHIPPSFFVPSLMDTGVAQAYGALMQWLGNKTHYSPAAVVEFQDHAIADPFLVATAMAHNYIIVTQEKPSSGSKKKVKIPDAALENGVQCIDLQQLLRRHASNNFQFVY